MGSTLPGQIVVSYPPVPPPGSIDVNIYADSPLELSGLTPSNTEHVITNGKTFKLQRIVIGAGKDPSEKGSMVELIYYNGTERLVARYFIDQKTMEIHHPDISKARDGTSMVGNGSTYKLIVRRTRLSPAAQAVDVAVYGFEE